MYRLVVLILVAVAAFVAITAVALEGQEVVVLRTRDDDGGVRETRTWVADFDGYTWIESANPERPFYRDILASPDVELVRGDRILLLRASVLPPEDGHPLIRRMLREKYGWADAWIGLLADTSKSTAIRLQPR